MGENPLYIDLDHSLIRTDVLWEQLARMLVTAPWKLVRAGRLLLKGRSSLKFWIAGQVDLPIEHLPWTKPVIDLAIRHRAAGGKVILATAASSLVARKVSEHLGIFDHWLASEEVLNLKGARKLEAIRTHSATLNSKEFGYVGDNPADLPIWEAAADCWLVTKAGGLVQFSGSKPDYEKLRSGPEEHRIRPLIKLMRPYQWSKNILLFVPLFFGQINDFGSVALAVLLAFCSFSLTASSVYVLNDFVDVFRDRQHPRKKLRPLASGDVPLWQAPVLCAALLVSGFLLAAFTGSSQFILVLCLYFISNLFYSLWIKHKPVADVIGLASMYTLRIFAGGTAASVEVSHWLLIFSMFFFLSLAFGKRYSELLPHLAGPDSHRKIRGYYTKDLPVISIGGLGSGLIAVLVLALYATSPQILNLYKLPDLLLLMCPLLAYWICRFWILTARGDLHEDPVLFALKDRVSWLICILTGLVILCSKYGATGTGGGLDLWKSCIGFRDERA